MRADELAGLEPLELVGELAGGRRSDRPGFARHRLLDDRDEIARHVGRARRERRRRRADDAREDLLDGRADVRRRAREHVVEHRAERVDVGALVDRLAARLLRRHVRRRADHRAGERSRPSTRRRRGTAPSTSPASRRAQILREPPVDHDGLAELADEHVRRLEIAVDDALAVRVRERVGDRDTCGKQREPLGDASRAAIASSSDSPLTSFIA